MKKRRAVSKRNSLESSPLVDKAEKLLYAARRYSIKADWRIADEENSLYCYNIVDRIESIKLQESVHQEESDEQVEMVSVKQQSP